MGFNNNAKPTKANIKRRLLALLEAAESGEELTRQWEPRGGRGRAHRATLDAFNTAAAQARAALYHIDA